MRFSLRAALVLCVVLPLAVSRVTAERRPSSSPSTSEPSWPFDVPVRPAVPDLDDPWIFNPIDAFILAKLDAHELRPNEPAGRLTLLRRVTFDLTGLPPTAEQQQRFLADHSAGAYERVVARLLASPRFGERMAERWLDLVRYADSDGFNEDRYRPGAYHYRDYCIRALNDDMPYDRFVRQQIAGDELESDNLDAQIATGFLRLGPEETNAAQLRQRRQEIIDETVNVVGQAFMGLTIGCAQCHDHKYDDIPQADYYRLAAFFQPMVQSQHIIATPDAKDLHDRQQARWEAATHDVRAEIDAIVAPLRKERYDEGRVILGPEVCGVLDKPVAERSTAERQIAAQADIFLEWKTRETRLDPKGDDVARYQGLLAKMATFDGLKPEPLPSADTVVDAGRDAPPTYCLALGVVERPIEQVEPAFPRLLGGQRPEIVAPSGQNSATGRRSALARWLTDAKHPLFARVIANRAWQWHFGTGLVATSSDFGSMGASPSHRELLDWLAVEL
ncbi:MAG TPA: DUF1549 domain-containing protein, partial [Pirellulales bacterium]|nr:DUF1549 domain-containing protein [Pirellulales bacterium]